MLPGIKKILGKVLSLVFFVAFGGGSSIVAADLGATVEKLRLVRSRLGELESSILHLKADIECSQQRHAHVKKQLAEYDRELEANKGKKKEEDDLNERKRPLEKEFLHWLATYPTVREQLQTSLTELKVLKEKEKDYLMEHIKLLLNECKIHGKDAYGMTTYFGEHRLTVPEYEQVIRDLEDDLRILKRKEKHSWVQQRFERCVREERERAGNEQSENILRRAAKRGDGTAQGWLTYLEDKRMECHADYAAPMEIVLMHAAIRGDSAVQKFLKYLESLERLECEEAEKSAPTMAGTEFVRDQIKYLKIKRRYRILKTAYADMMELENAVAQTCQESDLFDALKNTRATEDAYEDRQIMNLEHIANLGAGPGSFLPPELMEKYIFGSRPHPHGQLSFEIAVELTKKAIETNLVTKDAAEYYRLSVDQGAAARANVAVTKAIRNYFTYAAKCGIPDAQKNLDRLRW